MGEATVEMGAAVVCDVNNPTSGLGWCAYQDGIEARLASATCICNSFLVTRFHQDLQQCLERGQLTNDGPLLTVLQSNLKSLVRYNRRALLSCNGTAALHALAAGLDT